MQLKGNEYGALKEALLGAFTGYDDLADALRGADMRINMIAAPDAMPAVVRKVIEYAEARDTIFELVAGARAANPGNVDLLTLEKTFEAGLVAATDDVPTDGVLAQAKVQLERMVDGERGIADLGRFSARILEYVQRVCAVEAGQSKGTGFLIGPRTVLTNHHVVRNVIRGELAPEQVVLRFDYKRDRDGRVVSPGTEVRLAPDWLVHDAPYGNFDTQTYVEGTIPQAGELDYAVLRLARPLGNEPIGADRDSQPRGWVEPRAEEFEFADDAYLMVVQHPCHDPISYDYAFEAVTRVIGESLRVHYKVNTLPGSSGSPVLDRDQELVALHHAGQPGTADVFKPCQQQLTPADYNQCIPIATIQKDLAAHDLAWVFGKDAP